MANQPYTIRERQIIARAAEMDARREQQIRNQRDSINRLLLLTSHPGVDAATQEIAVLNEELAVAQRRIKRALEWAESHRTDGAVGVVAILKGEDE